MTSLEDTFREEADELLIDLEAAMLELEETPDDTECVDRAFRAMHTIKGSGSMFGFDKLAGFTHHLENAFDLVRSGQLKVTKELISISLDSGDHIRAMLEDINPPADVEQESAGLLQRLAELIPVQTETQHSLPATPIQSNPTELPDSADCTYRIRLKPCADTFASGMDPLPVIRELNTLGPCHTTVLESDVPRFDQLDAEESYLAWDLVLSSDKGRNTINDIFIFVEDDWDINVEVIDGGSDFAESEADMPIGEILEIKGDASKQQVETALAQQKKTGELLTENGVSADKVASALKEQKVVRENKKVRQQQAPESVKVPADKLDILMDLVGELVIAQARLNQSASEKHDGSLTVIAEDMERLTTDLRDNTLGLRMLPIGTTFARFRRLVRDLSNELGKQIKLVTVGAETELDKTVIDKLADPLVHLIRNSIDHGIEMPEQRIAAGKEETGTVHLSAVHSESHVVIKIKDDGAGLNTQAIREKAIERGIIQPDDTPTAQDLYDLIFDAGFSTAKTVSNISGRGVGMDVVKRSIESLRGSVWINSEPGKGSTVTVKLPLTLAIIEGLLVQVEAERYVLPLSIVEECVEITAKEVKQKKGGQLLEVRGELVPYLRLRDCFGHHKEDNIPQIEQVVVARVGEKRFGFAVDEVIGQHQTVIKALGKMYEGTVGLSGATILGDGAVALILDVAGLVGWATDRAACLH